MILAEEAPSPQLATAPPQPVAQQKPNEQKPPRDYAPEILGTFFQSVVPNFLHMAVAAEANDPEQAWQSLAGMFQGIGAIIDYGTRALKDDPSLDIPEALKIFIKSAQGKQFLINSSPLDLE